jgi:YHS domain-containing protein
MMLSMLLLTVALQGSDLKCPVMAGAVAKDSNIVEYRGAAFTFCCAGCDTNFAKAPDKFMATQKKAGNTVGQFLFDPISGKRIDPANAAATTDFGGLRYSFESEANLKAFTANAAKISVAPAKEALYCPVGNEAIASASKAWGYVDHQNVRWYLCCAGCETPFRTEPDKYITADAKKQIKNAGAKLLPKPKG